MYTNPQPPIGAVLEQIDVVIAAPNRAELVTRQVDEPAENVSGACMFVRTAQFPQAMSYPTPAGMTTLRDARTPPMGIE